MAEDHGVESSILSSPKLFLKMEDNKKKLEELKIEYNLLGYKLPNFQELLDDFDLLKICEKDSGYLLRDIRKTIIEKLSAYLQLFELIINPISPQLFIINLYYKIL